ncbi:HhH-GPD domain [Arabidopsis thaliana x Arabidopsis arenosa]|uniref:HhH-GPD domain n=1 Tax=Arabidopsis thaliana x Arabidopsis arenosa TaxID=1240361 RepID=A0A8T1Y1K7_9BRAS|nr:HhH-GPD domain [Arabidopsis thaliana x Arabidopsis arenosa]
MELSKDPDKNSVMIVPDTPVKTKQFGKFYVRRKAIKLPQDSVISPQAIKDRGEEESKENVLFPQDDSQNPHQKDEKKNSKENHDIMRDESEFFQDDDSQRVTGKGRRKNSKGTPRKQRFNRPRILEEGKKPRNPATTRLRTISNKRKRKDIDSEDEVIPEPATPNKQSVPKGRKNEKIKRNVARTLNFKKEIVLSCVEFDRICGPIFPKGRKRMTTLRRYDFNCLLLPMPIWKKQSRRSMRRKNVVRWARIASEDTLTRHVGSLVSKRNKKSTKNIVEYLNQQISYQKDHSLSSLADVPLHIEDTLMKSASSVLPEQPIKKTKDIAKLVKEMGRLKINKRVTTMIKSAKKLVTAKVSLDPETIKEWELLMVNDLPSRSYADKETEAKWKKEREIFQSRIDLFINRMHLLQGNRKFKQWKGSVVDSVVGVFLTQNVTDYLSSNAFMSVAAKFPVDAREGLESLAYYIEEPQDVNELVVDGQRPTHIGNNDAKSSEFITLSESISEVEEHENTAKRKNEKTGIMEDETVDWKILRKMYTKEGSRPKMHMDSVNWNDVRLSGQKVFETTIRRRGQFRILSERILKFLNDEVQHNGTVDLEWLRNAPSDLVKRYLLEIEGIGLKSAECVRLLGLKHHAFPVDTNVGRIAVRLGWVPLEPLPNGVQMHQLFQYPSMDSIQKYLWPRLCKLPQETLYELHYQMITFGKVFCTKVIPNCNACPMKSECKYFASAYVSSKVLLEGPEEKMHEPDTSMNAYSQDVDVDMTSKINLIEECVSPGCSDQAICCKPLVEFPSSPRAEIPESTDIEDIPCINLSQLYARVPKIDFDMDALKKNVEDALVTGGRMLSSSDEEISKALVVLTPENACIPIKPPRKMKYYDRLRTEHVVYVLPDNHELLHDFERRELDDPSPYLLAIWQPGETSSSFIPPKKKCNSDGSKLCKIKSCSYCWTIREQSSNIFRGTILIPCRTAMRAGFPLNGTYFQTNEVFADHETSLKPIVFPRELCDGLEKRALYCGSSVTSIFRFLDTRRIQLCFWTGFLCMRAFDRKQRDPKELVRRLHTPPDERGPKFMSDDI